MMNESRKNNPKYQTGACEEGCVHHHVLERLGKAMRDTENVNAFIQCGVM